MSFSYGDGVNYWSVNDKDKGSLPLESYALDHALLLWGYVDQAADRIAWYLETYVRGADGITPRSLSPGSNATASSLGPPGSLDLKHWEDNVRFADSFADYGRWVELWAWQRCGRCAMTTIDRDTLERCAEPLKTLGTVSRATV